MVAIEEWLERGLHQMEGRAAVEGMARVGMPQGVFVLLMFLYSAKIC